MHGMFMRRRVEVRERRRGGGGRRGWFERGNGWCNTELKEEMEISR